MGQKQATPEDITKCSICKDTVSDPEPLPLLHTYCLDCLVKEWGERNQKQKDRSTPKVKCMCISNVTSPPVKGGKPKYSRSASMLQSSFTTSSKKTLKCVCCEEATDEPVARCLECNGFLCPNCVKTHKTLSDAKKHEVVSIADLKSGRSDVRMMKRPPTCRKHAAKTLWLFCDTCGVMICRECAAAEHSEHQFAELSNVVNQQKATMEQLETSCNEIESRISEDMKRVVNIKENLDAAVEKTSREIDQAAEAWREHVDRHCREEKEKLHAWQSRIEKRMGGKRRALDGEAARLKTAREMAKLIVLSGTDYDVALNFVQLTNSLEAITSRTPPAALQNDRANSRSNLNDVAE